MLTLPWRVFAWGWRVFAGPRQCRSQEHTALPCAHLPHRPSAAAQCIPIWPAGSFTEEVVTKQCAALRLCQMDTMHITVMFARWRLDISRPDNDRYTAVWGEAHVICQLEGEACEQQGHGRHQADLRQRLADAVAGSLRKRDVALGLPVVACAATAGILPIDIIITTVLVV